MRDRPQRRRLVSARAFQVLLLVALGSGLVRPRATADASTDAASSSGEQPGSLLPLHDAGALNPNPPDETTKLVFIHHSCGLNWLKSSSGALGDALGDNNYYVSDTYFEWGPDSIGSDTDVGHWWLWFRSIDSTAYTEALYTTTVQNGDYTRPMADPGGENTVIMFKSCFPNSNLLGNPDDPPTTGDNRLRGKKSSSRYHTVGNAKGIYNDLLEYFRTQQDKLFVVITAPPLRDDTHAGNARAFNTWLVNNWLTNYPYHNVAVFDYYNVLTTNGGDADTNDLGLGTGNHHRVITATVPVIIEYTTNGDDDNSPDTLEYPTGGGSHNHPSAAGHRKATGEFVALLNVYYNCWKHGDCASNPADPVSLAAIKNTTVVATGEAATQASSLPSNRGFRLLPTLNLTNELPDTVASCNFSPIELAATRHLVLTRQVSSVLGACTVMASPATVTISDTARLSLVLVSESPASFTMNVPTTQEETIAAISSHALVCWRQIPMTKQHILIAAAVLAAAAVVLVALLGGRVWRWVRHRLAQPLPVSTEAVEIDGSYTNIVFLHHSTGHNLIREGNVRELFSQRGYKLWDHDYNTIGLTRPDGTQTYTSYEIPEITPGATGGGNTDPEGLAILFSQPVHDPPDNAFGRLLQHEVLIFKSCFPNSAIKSDEELQQNKSWYLEMRKVIEQHPDKVFILMTSPPLHPKKTTPEDAARARALATWLGSDEFLAGHPNLIVFDFFDSLADPDNNMLRDDYLRDPDSTDSHPNKVANQTIGPLFVNFVDRSIQTYRSTH